jgi:glc operon protein GlcG
MPGFRRIASAAILAALTSGWSGARGQPAGPTDLSQALAESMAQRCLARSSSNSWPPFSIAIVDMTGALVLLRRQDGASGVTADVALLKARSAVRAGAPTQALTAMGQDPATRDLFLLLQMTDDPGGAPLKLNGRLVGAIGISGGTVDQDVGCAAAAMTALPVEKK